MRSGRRPARSCRRSRNRIGRDDDLVAERRERFADKLLVRIGAIHFGRVEKRDASLEGGAKDLDALISVCRRTVIGANAHAAGAEFGDLQLSEPTGFHFCIDLLRLTWGCGRRQGTDARYGPDKGGRGQKVPSAENATRFGRRSRCLLILVHHQPLLKAEPPQPDAGASNFAPFCKVVRLAMPDYMVLSA